VIQDDVLFAAAPSAALLCLIVTFVIRFTGAASDFRQIDDPPERQARVRLAIIAAALGLFAIHAILVAAPAAVLRWNRSTPRLLLFEAVGMCCGLIVAAATAAAIRRRTLDAPHGPGGRLADLIALTIVAVAIACGLAVAAVYRWASSWSVVTLTPYARSLVQRTPRVELVAPLPFAVRLHVFSTFVIVALFPFTAAGTRVVAAAARRAREIGRLFVRTIRPATAAIQDWSKRAARSDELWREEEM
jgi:nitrate reductase gamma subunit